MTLDEYLFTVQDTANFHAAMLREQDAERLHSEAKVQLEKDDLDNVLFMTDAELANFKNLAETVIQDLADDIAELPADYENKTNFTEQWRLDNIQDCLETNAAEFLDPLYLLNTITSAKDLYTIYSDMLLGLLDKLSTLCWKYISEEYIPPKIDADVSEGYASPSEDSGTYQHSPAPTASTPVTSTLLQIDSGDTSSDDELAMLIDEQNAENDPTALCYALLDQAYNSTPLSPTNDGFAW